MTLLQVTHAFTCRRIGRFRGVCRLVLGSAVDVTKGIAVGCGVALRNAIQHVVGLYGGHITSAVDIGVAVSLPPKASRIGENSTIERRTLHTSLMRIMVTTKQILLTYRELSVCSDQNSSCVGGHRASNIGHKVASHEAI